MKQNELQNTPPTPQQDLWAYLKSWQKPKVAAVLRLLRPRYQRMLCIQLLDYMETGVLPLTTEVMLDTFAFYLVSPENSSERAIIAPLCATPAVGQERVMGVNISLKPIH